MTIRLGGVAAVAAVAAVMVLAACSSGGSTSGGTSGSPAASGAPSASSGSSAGASGYEQVYQQYTKPPVFAPIAKLVSAPPKNISAVFVGCPLTTCLQESDGATAAMHALGWKVTQINAALTPQGWVSAWNEIVQLKPKVAFYVAALPASVVKSQMIAATKNGTILMEENGGIGGPGDQPVGTGAPGAAVSDVFSMAQEALGGQVMGAVVQHDAGGKANAVFVYDPTLEIYGPYVKSFDSFVTSTGGTVSNLQSPLTEIGKTMPGQIVNFLRSHPKVTQVVLIIADMLPGVTEALQSAGLASKVKIYVGSMLPSTEPLVQSGAVAAGLGLQDPYLYIQVDQAVRKVMGMSSGPQQPLVGVEVYTKGTAHDFPNLNNWPSNRLAAYEAAWGV
jgi:hypothetical protein